MRSRLGLFILIGLFLYLVDYRFSYDKDLNQIIIPDDEVLGCGATLSRFAREGCNTHILILATGLTSRGNVDIKQIRDLQDEAKSDARCLGDKSISFENFGLN